jgi:hypothetical protein
MPVALGVTRIFVSDSIEEVDPISARAKDEDLSQTERQMLNKWLKVIAQHHLSRKATP